MPEEHGLTLAEVVETGRRKSFGRGTVDGALSLYLRGDVEQDGERVRLVQLLPGSPLSRDFWSPVEPEHRDIKAFQFVRAVLDEMADELGAPFAKLPRATIVKKGIEKGLTTHAIEVAITVTLLSGSLVEKDGLIHADSGTYAMPFDQRDRKPAGRVAPESSREFEEVLSMVKEIIKVRGVPVGVAEALANPKVLVSVGLSGQPKAEATPMSPRIFISHDSDNAAIAELLIDFLKAGLVIEDLEIRCTSIAGHRLVGGDDTRSELRDDIHASEVVLCLITPDSIDSDWVLLELGAAWVLSKPAIAIVAHGATFKELPPIFGLKHALQAAARVDMSGLFKGIAKWTTIKTRTENPEKVQAQLEKLVACAATARIPPPAQTQSASLPVPASQDNHIMLLKRWAMRADSIQEGHPISYGEVAEGAKVPVESATSLLDLGLQGTPWRVIERRGDFVVLGRVPESVVDVESSDPIYGDTVYTAADRISRGGRTR